MSAGEKPDALEIGCTVLLMLLVLFVVGSILSAIWPYPSWGT